MTSTNEPKSALEQSGWIDVITRTLGEKTSCVFLVAVALTFYEVVSRYFFNAPTTWVHEVSIFMTAACFIIAGSYTLQRRDHIRISLVIDSVSPRARHWLNVVNAIVALYFLTALAYGAAVQAGKSIKVMERTGTASDLPIPVTLKSLLVVGVTLMILQGLVHLVRELRRKV